MNAFEINELRTEEEKQQLKAFHTESLNNENLEGFELDGSIKICSTRLLPDETDVCPVMWVNNIPHHLLNDRVVQLQKSEHYEDFDVETPCTANADELFGFHLRPQPDFGEEELKMIDVVHSEEEVCAEARWYARLNTRVWGAYIFFNGTRYKLACTTRNEMGQFARTYTIVERAEHDELEDLDIYTPAMGISLRSDQNHWYRKINDDHRGLDIYDKAWAEDVVLYADDVRVHRDAIEFCCPEHCLTDYDYISVPLIGAGTHEITVDGQWLSIAIEQVSEDEATETEDLLQNKMIEITTLKKTRETVIDSRDQHYDGGEDTAADQMELQLQKI